MKTGEKKKKEEGKRNFNYVSMTFPNSFVQAFTFKSQIKQVLSDKSREWQFIFKERECRLEKKLWSSICATQFVCSYTYLVEKDILMNLCMKLLTFGKCRETFNPKTKLFQQRTVQYSKIMFISKRGLTCILSNKMKVLLLLTTFRICLTPLLPM